MEICATLNNTTLASTNTTPSQALLDDFTDFIPPSYFRPDNGRALIPWLYSMRVIMVVINHVVLWKRARSWCLVSTVFTVIVYTQAYIPTQFDSAQISVWTPPILITDAGSILQLFFLIIETKKV